MRAQPRLQRSRLSEFIATASFFFAVLIAPAPVIAAELVRVDDLGVIRWRADDREVALFGANYCLPSSCDYRAAGYIGADRKKLVEQDLLHFARMGWDGMRLCLWGDWENSDVQGNLIVNDHLDLMDLAIAEAKKRGIYILLTPITTYAAWWPDAKATDDYPGFSKHFEKSRLGADPAAIAAQVNYLRQMMNHVNPYTGIALKDEPQIIFVEMINEPWHHADDFSGSVDYINALVGAVRSTGCEKILFHNISQDMRILSAVRASQAQGVTFAWYPTGLNVGRTLDENHLRSVDSFAPMLRPELTRVPKIVYEFDAPDMSTGVMFPAMARAFRGVGSQFAAMFSYDMLATAPYNLGWQTHFLNLVYSPRKAVSAVIAAEVSRVMPRYADYGDYPDNTRFGPFRLSYEDDLSEMVTEDALMHSNDTRTAPPSPAKLRRIVGLGSSPVIDYEGSGAYFIDKLDDGLWRLELYPDAVLVQDPFAQKLNFQTVSSRLVWRTWPMTVRLPDLGETFVVTALNEGNATSVPAREGRFGASPGVYLLSREARIDRARLPARVGPVGLSEFVCPPAPKLPAHILSWTPAVFGVDGAATFEVEVVDANSPRAVTLHLRARGDAVARVIPMARQRGYRHAVTLPQGTLAAGPVEYHFEVETAAAKVRHPADPNQEFTARVIGAAEPLVVFDAARDMEHLVYTRIGDNVRRGVFKSMPATEADPAALRLMLPLSMDRTLDDYTTSLGVKPRVLERAGCAGTAEVVRIKARGSVAALACFVTFVEADGTSWSTRLHLAEGWTDCGVPLGDLRLAQGVKLPLGYPERWNYWISPAKGRGHPGDHLNVAAIERVQISLRPESDQKESEKDAWADVASIALEYR